MVGECDRPVDDDLGSTAGVVRPRGIRLPRLELFTPGRRIGDPLQEIDAYGLVNASVGFAPDQGWKVTLWGKNLTDEDYFTNVTRQPVGSEPNWVTARIGMELNYG